MRAEPNRFNDLRCRAVALVVADPQFDVDAFFAHRTRFAPLIVLEFQVQLGMFQVEVPPLLVRDRSFDGTRLRHLFSGVDPVNLSEQVRDTGPVRNPLVRFDYLNARRIPRLRDIEEKNNFISIHDYRLQGELSPEVPDEQITLYRPARAEDIKRLLSYGIGCMMSRYS